MAEFVRPLVSRDRRHRVDRPDLSVQSIGTQLRARERAEYHGRALDGARRRLLPRREAEEARAYAAEAALVHVGVHADVAKRLRFADDRVLGRGAFARLLLCAVAGAA